MPDRNSPDRSGGLPDSVFFNPQNLVQAQQRISPRRLEGTDPDRGLWAVGVLMLAGIGGWAAFRHFPKNRVGGVVGEIKSLLSNPKKFGFPDKELEKLRYAVRSISDTIAKQPWAHVHQDNFGTVLGQSRAAQDPTILNTLRTLREHLQRNPKWGANVAAAKRLPTSHLVRPIPQDSTGLRKVRIRDLFDPDGGFRHDIWGHTPDNLPRQLQEVQNVLTDIHQKIPGLKINQQLGEMAIDPGLLMHQSKSGVSRLVNLQKVHPGNILKGLGERAMKGRVGQAGGAPWWKSNVGSRLANWAAELMLPTELLGTGPQAFATRGSIVGSASRGQIGQLFLGGNVHRLLPNGQIGGAIATGLIGGRSATRMGMMSRVRGQALRTAAAIRDGVMPGNAYASQSGALPGSWRRLGLAFGDKIGIGPQYSVKGMGLATDEFPTDSLLETAIDLVRDPKKATRQVVSMFTGKRPVPELAEQFYATSRLQGMGDYANFLLHRVGHLLTSTTAYGKFPGIGIRPGATAAGTLGRWLTLGAIGYGAIQGTQYVDYHMRRITNTGPITGAAQLYTGTRFAGQAALEGLGIQQGAAYLEDLMPGSVESGASRLGRAVAATRYIGGAYGKALGLAAGLATVSTDLTQSSGNLAAMYRGDVDVAVREGRGWVMGTQPFSGGRIKHYRPHLIAQYMSRARDISIHGGESEAWGNSLFPTPESWFGAKPLLFPYEVERRHYKDRPYPQTSPMFEEVPIIGPLLSSTLGEIIKPSQKWHGEYWDGGLQEGPSGIQGLGAIPRQRAGDPSRPLEVIGKQIDILKDFLGMPGFLFGAMKNAITGADDFNVSNRQVATSGAMTSMSRAYYDMDAGGLLGFSELFRRFLPHRRRQIEQVNPIANQMPAWLPGSFSAFPGDRDSYRDYHRGDAYSGIAHGESRLPGAGYETLHRLHSGIPGKYDPMDRWRILKDVAPNSQAFRHYDAIVRSWASVGLKQSQQKAGGLMGAIGIRSMRGIVTSVVDGDTLTVNIGGKLTTVRLNAGDAPEIPHSGKGARPTDPTRVAQGQLARTRLSQHVLGREVSVTPLDVDPYGRLVANITRPGYAGRDVSADLQSMFPAYDLSQADQGKIQRARFDIEQQYQPYPFTERIFNDPSARIPRNMRQMVSRSQIAINRAIKEQGEYSYGEKLVGRAWETMSHVSLPGPLNWPINKLFPQRDAMEYYRMRQLGGGFADWKTPVASFIQPWMQQTIGAAFPNYIPGDVVRQQNAIENLDMLQYTKMQRLSGRATLTGDQMGAKHYRKQALSTMTGAIVSGNRRFVRGALPRRDRAFYTPFARETSPERRQRILEIAPPMFGTLLRQAWGEDIGPERGMIRGAAAEMAGMTPRDWAGWHPGVPMHLMKVKVAKNEGWDAHDLGISYREQYAAEDLFDNYSPSLAPAYNPSSSLQSEAYNMGNRLQLDGMQISVREIMGPSTMTMNIGHDRRRRRRHFDLWDSLEMTGRRF